jgi:hypothetical protein
MPSSFANEDAASKLLGQLDTLTRPHVSPDKDRTGIPTPALFFEGSDLIFGSIYSRDKAISAKPCASQRRKIEASRYLYIYIYFATFLLNGGELNFSEDFKQRLPDRVNQLSVCKIRLHSLAKLHPPLSCWLSCPYFGAP